MINIKSLSDFQNTTTSNPKVAIHFWAGWCEPCALLDQVLEQLAHDAPSVTCARVEAEEVSDVSELVGVSVVPLLVFYSGGKEVNRVEGADPAALTTTFMSLANAPTAVGNGHGAVANGTPASASAPASAEPPTTSASSQRIESLVKQRPIMLFMKGSPGAPRCGFSRRVVEALENALGGTLHPSTFGYFDILTDDGVREGLKQYSQWPTYPQLYVNGELVGGCDIVLEMAETGDLAAELSKVSISADRDATREDPKAALEARLKELVKRQDVMLFMKGSPEAPQCGFSRKVVEALQNISQPFGSFDILTDNDVRQGLKEYSQWPTYPQLYVNGELVGGCDIVLEIAETGELKSSIDDMLHAQ